MGFTPTDKVTVAGENAPFKGESGYVTEVDDASPGVVLVAVHLAGHRHVVWYGEPELSLFVADAPTEPIEQVTT
jgi:hypothetical protein